MIEREREREFKRGQERERVQEKVQERERERVQEREAHLKNARRFGNLGKLKDAWSIGKEEKRVFVGLCRAVRGDKRDWNVVNEFAVVERVPKHDLQETETNGRRKV